MRLKLGVLVSCCYLLACSLVSGKNADAVTEKDDNLMVTNIRPTEAGLKKSTVKPTSAPIKAPIPTRAIVLNVPPKSSGQMEENSQPLSELFQAQPEIIKRDSIQKVLTESPSLAKGETLKADLIGSDAESVLKPVQVTGFVTENGKIYEIEDKDGIGLIEGRQNPIDEKMNVCNYGNIVIYSDVPCEEVTNIHVGDIVQTTLKDDRDQLEQTQNQNLQQQQQPQPQQPEQQSHNNSAEELSDVEELKPPRRRNGQKRRRAQQNNQMRRRKNKNRNRQQISANRNQQKRRRQPTPQKRRKQQQNRRRLQNQQYSTQRRQQKNRNRVQQRPHRRHRNGSIGQKGGNTNRNRRQNQRLQQTRRRQQEYGRQHFDDYDY